MWLRRAKSRIRIHNAPPPPTFATCSSFKDIHFLLSDDENNDSFSSDSPKKPKSICHRILTLKSKSLIRSHSQPSLQPTSEPQIHIPSSQNSILIYFTSLRVVRRTFEDCKTVRSILRTFPVSIDERDLSMDSAFTDELIRILNLPEKSKLSLPRVFIAGKYIGGVEEVRRLHESGELKKYVEALPVSEAGTCEVCGGHRFVVCHECSGSHKCFKEKGGGFRSCTSCNENGLVRCPSCSSAPL